MCDDHCAMRMHIILFAAVPLVSIVKCAAIKSQRAARTFYIHDLEAIVSLKSSKFDNILVCVNKCVALDQCFSSAALGMATY